MTRDNAAGPRLTSLPEQLASSLAMEIVTGGLPGGSRLHEQELADRFGVSRSTVREAIWILERDGLAVVQPRRGAGVVHLDAVAEAEIGEVAEVLLAQMAALAAKRMAKGQVANLRLVWEAMKASRDGAASSFTVAHLDFVLNLAGHASNPALREQIRVTMSQLGPRMTALCGHPAFRDRLLDGWSAVLAAIEIGEPDRARDLVPWPWRDGSALSA